MFYCCSNCGAVYFFLEIPKDNEKEKSHKLWSHACRIYRFVPISITISNNAYNYSEAGGEITGIEVDSTVSIDVEE